MYHAIFRNTDHGTMIYCALTSLQSTIIKLSNLIHDYCNYIHVLTYITALVCMSCDRLTDCLQGRSTSVITWPGQYAVVSLNHDSSC